MVSALPPQHPQRLAMSLELHARPFPELSAPCRAVHVAFKAAQNAADRDPELDRAHLRDLLDRFGAAHPPPNADHYVGSIGRVTLKWERHTEFVSYTLFGEGVAESPYDGSTFRLFPRDWLEEAPGLVVAASLVRVESVENAEAAEARLSDGLGRHFVREALAASRVADGLAVVGSDFRIHEDGMSRFVVLARPELGPRRLGRLVQRLVEIETYRAMSMLALPIARTAIRRLGEIDRELATCVAGFAEDEGSERATLDLLTRKSAEIEKMATDGAFRFGAARAYEAIVHERIEALREERMGGRQTVGEFMQRRYDPAMRTCKAAERRLEELSTRAARIADLLRTRVDVAIGAQNQSLLASMNRRADLQLRLQKTVEGLSVVAISYYAVSLLAYVLDPVATATGISEEVLTAGLVPIVFLGVLAMVRRLRREIDG
ncbi:MAG TPA: DUF3422 domain-containing protein [Paracoccaceae bacterium]|nr:DUF3422 domain-containing protein [Paracoccaceae bacterium]